MPAPASQVAIRIKVSDPATFYELLRTAVYLTGETRGNLVARLLAEEIDRRRAAGIERLKAAAS